MKKLILALTVMFLTVSVKAQSQMDLSGRIVSMPSNIKVLAEKDRLGQWVNGRTHGNTTYKLAYPIDTGFIRSATVFPDRKIVWLTYGDAQAGPKYIGELREDFEFVVETSTGVRKTVKIRASTDSKKFVSIHGSTKNGRSGPLDGISINTSDSSLVEIH